MSCGAKKVALQSEVVSHSGETLEKGLICLVRADLSGARKPRELIHCRKDEGLPEATAKGASLCLGEAASLSPPVSELDPIVAIRIVSGILPRKFCHRILS